MEGFTITAINERPEQEDLVNFASNYFEEIRKRRNMLADRGVGNFRTGLYLCKEWNGQLWLREVYILEWTEDKMYEDTQIRLSIISEVAFNCWHEHLTTMNSLSN